jgi:hypothetical protein
MRAMWRVQIVRASAAGFIVQCVNLLTLTTQLTSPHPITPTFVAPCCNHSRSSIHCIIECSSAIVRAGPISTVDLSTGQSLTTAIRNLLCVLSHGAQRTDTMGVHRKGQRGTHENERSCSLMMELFDSFSTLA